MVAVIIIILTSKLLQCSMFKYLYIGLVFDKCSCLVVPTWSLLVHVCIQHFNIFSIILLSDIGKIPTNQYTWRLYMLS